MTPDDLPFPFFQSNSTPRSFATVSRPEAVATLVLVRESETPLKVRAVALPELSRLKRHVQPFSKHIFPAPRGDPVDPLSQVQRIPPAAVLLLVMPTYPLGTLPRTSKCQAGAVVPIPTYPF